MGAMNYQQAWNFLDRLQFFKIKLGLESMNRFLERLGNPQRQLSCIHVGGTNGKGSVGATLCSILSSAGCSTGLYTSPHLSSVRERFKINDQFISRQDFARLISRIHDVLDGSQITYFECTTTLALLWFAEQNVDLAILEVVMGGRLDATNVITPLISIITNVSMDHEQYLGNTLSRVAMEKAGIIKDNIPVISGVANDDSGRIIRQTCRDRQAPLFLLNRDFSGGSPDIPSGYWRYQGMDGVILDKLPLALRGRYQAGNAALALAAVQLLQKQGVTLDDKQIRKGLARTRWPGRMETFTQNNRNFLLDGAHNPAGIVALKQTLAAEFAGQRLISVWAAMADKDLQTTLQDIAPMADAIIFTRPESERSATPDQLLEILPPELRQRALGSESVAEAIEHAIRTARPEDLICVAGSLYLVGAARQLLLGGVISAG